MLHFPVCLLFNSIISVSYTHLDVYKRQLHTFIELPPGVKYAANVITPEVVSFQVKGTIKPEGLQVDEIYACGPPVPGKKIYPSPKVG